MSGDMIFFSFVIVLFLIIFLFIAALMVSNSNSRKKKINLKLKSIPEFNPEDVDFLSSKDCLSIDAKNKKLVVITNCKEMLVLNFSDLLSVEVLRDGNSIIKTNRGSQAIGSVVGGVLFGPVGLLIGGLSGSKKNIKTISKLTLKIYTTDIIFPVKEITFYDGPPIKVSGIMNNALSEKSDKWYGRIKAIIESQ